MNIVRALSYITDLLIPLAEEVRIARAVDEEMLFARIDCRALHTETSALFSYRDPVVRPLIHALKYHKERRVAELFGIALAAHARKILFDDAYGGTEREFLLVPIPLSRARMRERGYNQTELIAKAWSARCPELFLLPHALLRTRDIESQTRQESRSARLENMHGVFAASPHVPVRGRTVVLLDDVATTGSTLRDARRALLDAGAMRVIALAVAH